MGTRGLVGVQINGMVYADYRKYDSYPEHAGKIVRDEITDWMRYGRLERYRDKAKQLIVKAGTHHSMATYINPLEALISRGYVEDQLDFAKSDLCEWIYVANFDSNVLEMYFRSEAFVHISFHSLIPLEEIHIDHLMDVVAESVKPEVQKFDCNRIGFSTVILPQKVA